MVKRRIYVLFDKDGKSFNQTIEINRKPDSFMKIEKVSECEEIIVNGVLCRARTDKEIIVFYILADKVMDQEHVKPIEKINLKDYGFSISSSCI